MIIGMRGHDFGRMEPRALAAAIRETGFEATQLAFTKAFPAPAEQYMTREALCDIREAFAGLALPVMGCYVSASDRDPDALAEAKARFKRALSASVTLGAGCVGTETTHFTFPESACWISPARSAPTRSRSTRWWALSRSRCTRSIRRS